MKAGKRSVVRERQLKDLLTRDHTLNGGILLGLDGYVIEVQARAMTVLRGPEVNLHPDHWKESCNG
jgi:magnesium chelatase family protein